MHRAGISVVIAAARTVSRRLAVWKLAAVLLLVAAAPCFGQGTMNAVPDPISSRELAQYAKQLGLSEYQLQAVSQFHDLYLADFRVLRETDIEKFLNESRGAERGFGLGMGMNMDRAEIEKAFKQSAEILNKIKAVDNRLFAQIQTVLTEDQLANLPRVQQSRERARYRTGLTGMTRFLNPAMHVDLSEIVLNIDLTPQERSTIDSPLAQYEASLTTAVRKLHESTNSLAMEAVDRMQAIIAAAGGQDEGGQGRRNEIFQSVRTMWSELAAKLMQHAASIIDLNHRTVRSLAPMLSSEHAHLLRREFLQQGYAEVLAGAGTVARSLEEALKLEDLSDEQRQIISDLAGGYFASFDRITDQMVELIDKNRQSVSIFDFGSDRRREFEQQMDDLREQRDRLNANTSQLLMSALGEQLSEQLNHRTAQGRGDKSSGVIVTRFSGAGGGAAVGGVAAVSVRTEPGNFDASMADPYVPGPITRRDLERYAARLGLSESFTDILASLHEDYLQAFDALEQSEIKAVREAEQSLWAMDAQGQVKPPTPEAIDNLYALRKKALTSILHLDAEFFNNVEAALLGPEHASAMQRVRASRTRDVYNRAVGQGFGLARAGRRLRRGPGGMFMMGNAANQANIDLTALVSELALGDEERKAVDATLTEYEAAATAVFQKMYESAVRAQLARDKAIAEMSADRNGDRRPSGRAASLFGGQSEDDRIAREARAEAAALNKNTLGSLMAALPPAAAQQLKTAFDRRAYPEIFDDPRSADRHLSAALALPDLTDQQLSQIQQIAAEYRSEYHQLSDKLVQLQTLLPDFNDPPFNRDWQAIQDAIRQSEKVQFERNELSDKTMMRLKAALTDDQVQRLDGLRIADADEFDD